MVKSGQGLRDEVPRRVTRQETAPQDEQDAAFAVETELHLRQEPNRPTEREANAPTSKAVAAVSLAGKEPRAMKKSKQAQKKKKKNL